MTDNVQSRVETLTRDWNITIEVTHETPTSVLAFGWRADAPIVLKVLREPGDEWRSGDVARAFAGRGVVRVLEAGEGATLLERILPGTPLANLVLAGRDDEATGILADVIRQMDPARVTAGCPTVEDWAPGFDHYLRSADPTIPRKLVEEARDMYLQLCRTQRNPRLLHGDLHHGNVLFDANRGWLAIDPKGVVGEIEYEIGAALRNPVDRPDLFASAGIVRRRVRQFELALDLDGRRTRQWAFAQAVLSAIWDWQDGNPIKSSDPFLMVAREIQKDTTWPG